MDQKIKCIRCKGTGRVVPNYRNHFNNAAFPFLFILIFPPIVSIVCVYYYLIRYLLPFQILLAPLFFFGGISMGYLIFRRMLGPLFTTKLHTIIYIIILCYIGYLNVKLEKYQIGENIKNVDKYSWYIMIQALCIGMFLIICPNAEGMDKCPVCDGTKEISIEKYNKIKRYLEIWNDNGYEDFYFAQKLEWNYLRAFEVFFYWQSINIHI